MLLELTYPKSFRSSTSSQKRHVQGAKSFICVRKRETIHKAARYITAKLEEDRDTRICTEIVWCKVSE